MDMLLGFVGIVPLHLRLEAAGLRIEFDRGEIGAHDAFQRVDVRAGPESVEWIGPCGPIAQAHRIVIPIRETKPHEESTGSVRP